MPPEYAVDVFEVVLDLPRGVTLEYRTTLRSASSHIIDLQFSNIRQLAKDRVFVLGETKQ